MHEHICDVIMPLCTYDSGVITCQAISLDTHFSTWSSLYSCRTEPRVAHSASPMFLSLRLWKKSTLNRSHTDQWKRLPSVSFPLLYIITLQKHSNLYNYRKSIQMLTFIAKRAKTLYTTTLRHEYSCLWTEHVVINTSESQLPLVWS